MGGSCAGRGGWDAMDVGVAGGPAHSIAESRCCRCDSDC